MENNKQTLAPDVNLDKLRDEKCIPVAQLVLEDIASDMMPEDANEKVDYNPVTLKILQRTLDADTNISTENSYIFQLLFGVFQSLNKTVQECNTIPIDDIRYGVIAKKILGTVADAHVRMGTIADADKDADFAQIKEKLNELFSAEQLSLLEVKYIMDNILDSFNTVQGLFSMNVEISSAKAIAKSMGLESVNDLSMKKLDDVLKSA